jgi:hypothetical protein
MVPVPFVTSNVAILRVARSAWVFAARIYPNASGKLDTPRHGNYSRAQQFKIAIVSPKTTRQCGCLLSRST